MIWREWSEKAAKRQVFRADAENREKSREHFYKIDEKNLITIRKELSEDFYAMAQVQTAKTRKVLEEFEDDQLQLTLELEAYEQERVQLAKQQNTNNQDEQTIISDEEQLVVGLEQTLTEEEQAEKRAEQLVEQEPLQQRAEDEESR